jgi:ABC-2 type transport system permease protein
MKVFRRLLAHEWRMLTRDRAFWILATLLVVLIAGAVHSGASWARVQGAAVEAIRQHDDRLFARLTAQVRALERRGIPPEGRPLAGMAWYLLHDDAEPPPAPHLDPRRPEATGSEWVAARYAVLPPEPLAALSIGQGDLYPYYTRVTIRTKPALLNNDEIENPATLLSGRFDLAFVLIFCWPLIALPLIYDLLARERDDQTLMLTLAQPVSIRTVALAKIVTRGGSLVVLTLVAGFVALASTGSLQGDGVIVRLALWSSLVMANAALWLGLALLVNAARLRAAASAMTLAGAWLACVLIIPSAVNVSVAAWAPVPTRVELLSEMRKATNAATGDVSRLVAHYYEEHPELAPPDSTPQKNAVRSVTLQEESERRLQPILDAFDRDVREQQALARRLRVLSPAILLQDAMNELAGTTASRYQRFMSQVDAHHVAWRAFFHPRIFAGATLTAADYDRMPRFEYQPESLAAVTARVGASAGLVLLLGAALLGVGLFALRWYVVAG